MPDILPLLTGFERTVEPPYLKGTPFAWLWLAPSPVGVVPPANIGLQERWAYVTWGDARRIVGDYPADLPRPGWADTHGEEARIRTAWIDVQLIPTAELRNMQVTLKKQIAGALYSYTSNDTNLAIIELELVRRLNPGPTGEQRLNIGYKEGGGFALSLIPVVRPYNDYPPPGPYDVTGFISENPAWWQRPRGAPASGPQTLFLRDREPYKPADASVSASNPLQPLLPGSPTRPLDAPPVSAAQQVAAALATGPVRNLATERADP